MNLTHRRSGEMMSSLSIDPAFFELLTGSYQRLVGQPLVPQGSDATWLYERAPFCVLSHNTDADPRFIYANRAAQHCFDYDWVQFTQLPSRLSAEAPNRAERQSLLDRVHQQGYASGYTGIRISRTGRRFWIREGLVWQLQDAEGVIHGQAAVFHRWDDV
ncbi:MULTISPECIES: MEKHLA domain-containing protein [Pseudomonas]|uniref:MEKHLA domain-containing protein n=1 Tax=Pseudomonas TaxID=286 RepID=UPI001FD140E0|nr:MULTISPECIES: MEKHLA domain-containing protein [Pseudomonas]